MIDHSLSVDDGAVWEPWTPKVGDRVRVRLTGECPMHDVPNYPLRVHDMAGVILLDTREDHPFLVRQDAEASREVAQNGHHWFVRFERVVGIYFGQPINCDDFCASELEPLDGES